MEGTKALKIKSYGKLEIETQNSYLEKTKIVTYWQLFLKQNKCLICAKIYKKNTHQ